MKKFTRFFGILAVLGVGLATLPALADESKKTNETSVAPGGWSMMDKTHKKRVLFFSKSSGFEHGVVRRHGADQLSFAEKVMVNLGAQNGFDVSCSKDGRIFDVENMSDYDAIVFFTSGMLTESGKDNNPPMTAQGKATLLAAIRNGKGFVGIHSANDSFHFQPDSPEQRVIPHGANVDPYIAMLGSEFIKHGPEQRAQMIVADPRFPGTEGLNDGFESLDEWYTFKDFTPDIHVILIQNTKGMRGLDYQRAPFPATWAKMYGRGRVFYTSMGHREDVWESPRFQNVILGGLGWASGNVMADVTPNIETATPGYREIQAQQAPQKKAAAPKKEKKP